MSSNVLLLGVKFAQYGNNVVTATYKLAVLLALSGARVLVTSVSTDEEQQDRETELAEEVTKRARQCKNVTSGGQQSKESSGKSNANEQSSPTNTDCTEKERLILDLLKNKSEPVKTLVIAKTLGYKIQKDVNPILYPLEKKKKIVKCSDSPVTWKLAEDAPGSESSRCTSDDSETGGSIEVIFPLEHKTRREGSPSHHWVAQLHGTFYDFSDERKYRSVSHVIGFVPTTGGAAVGIRNQWKDATEHREPDNVHDAKVILVNVAQVKDGEDEDFFKEMCSGLKKADVVFSFGPKLFRIYQDVYRSQSLKIEHKMLVLFPDLLDSAEKWSNSEATKIVTFCAPDIPTHEKGGTIVESCTKDYRLVFTCLDELGKMRALQSEDKPQWNLCALQDDDPRLQEIQSTLDDSRAVNVNKRPTVTSEKQLLSKIRNCTVVMTPESDSDSFNFLDWECVGFGTPALRAQGSGVAFLLKTLQISINSRSLVHLQGHDDSDRWKQCLYRNVLNDSALPEDWASELRKKIRDNSTIKQAIQEFLFTFNLTAIPSPPSAAAATHHMAFSQSAESSSSALFSPSEEQQQLSFVDPFHDPHNSTKTSTETRQSTTVSSSQGHLARENNVTSSAQTKPYVVTDCAQTPPSGMTVQGMRLHNEPPGAALSDYSMGDPSLRLDQQEGGGTVSHPTGGYLGDISQASSQLNPSSQTDSLSLQFGSQLSLGTPCSLGGSTQLLPTISHSNSFPPTSSLANQPQGASTHGYQHQYTSTSSQNPASQQTMLAQPYGIPVSAQHFPPGTTACVGPRNPFRTHHEGESEYGAPAQTRQSQPGAIAGAGEGAQGGNPFRPQQTHPIEHQVIPSVPVGMQEPWGAHLLFEAAGMMTSEEKVMKVGLGLRVDENIIESIMTDYRGQVNMMAFKVLNAWDGKCSENEQEKRQKLRKALYKIDKASYIHEIGL